MGRMPKTGRSRSPLRCGTLSAKSIARVRKDIPAAIQTFEVAVGPSRKTSSVARSSVSSISSVARLPRQAVNEQMFLIDKDPYRVEAYKALRRIYMDSRQFDKAWCMCSALTYLQRADADEQQFYEQYKKGLPKARNKLTDEMWAKYIYHKDEDRFIGAIFATVYSAVGNLRAAEHKQYGLKRKESAICRVTRRCLGACSPTSCRCSMCRRTSRYSSAPSSPAISSSPTAREKNLFIPSIVVGQGCWLAAVTRTSFSPSAVFLARCVPSTTCGPSCSRTLSRAVAILGGAPGSSGLPGAAAARAVRRPVLGRDGSVRPVRGARAPGHGGAEVHRQQVAARHGEVGAGGRSDVAPSGPCGLQRPQCRGALPSVRNRRQLAAWLRRTRSKSWCCTPSRRPTSSCARSSASPSAVLPQHRRRHLLRRDSSPQQQQNRRLRFTA